MSEQFASEPFEMRFPRSTGNQEVLERSIYALAELLSATIADDGEGWVVTIHPRRSADATDLAHRFRQEVVDQSLRSRIAEQTDPLRTLVWALAFSRSGLAESTDR